MGIRGLTKRLGDVASAVRDDPSRADAVLVDASAFAFSCLELLSDVQPTYTHHGSRPDAFRARFEAGVRLLMDAVHAAGVSHGVDFVFVFDGPHTQCKSDTHSKRKEERSVKPANLWQFWASGRRPSQVESHMQFPLPPLAFYVLAHVIEQHPHTHLHRGVAEGDVEIASLISLSYPHALVLSEDSDFYVFGSDHSDPLYGRLSRLFSNRELICTSKSSLTKGLGLRNPNSIVIASLLLGNDYYRSGRLSAETEEGALIDIPEKWHGFDNVDFDKIDALLGDSQIVDVVGHIGAVFSFRMYTLQSVSNFEYDEDAPSESLDAWSSGCVAAFGHDLYVDMDEAIAGTLDLLRAADAPEHCVSALEEGFGESTSDDEDVPLFGDPNALWTAYIVAYTFQRCVARFWNKSGDASMPPARIFDGAAYFARVARYERAVNGGLASHAVLCDDEEEEEEVVVATKDVLPIDSHEDEILEAIASRRVTIICGETGSGKSSRLPSFLVESDPNNVVIVSEPKRIAAHSLFKRVQSTSNDPTLVGIRMGFGIRNETKNTRLWYCTAGYLRAAAATSLRTNRGFITDATHFVVDEVHERSVDTDVLLFLVRTLMKANPHLKLILMSATLAADFLSAYFDAPQTPLFVGVSRFESKIRFLEDLTDEYSKASPLFTTIGKSCAELSKAFGSGRTTKSPSDVNSTQVTLAFHLIKGIGRPGRTLLVFVEGIATIEALGTLLLAPSQQDFFEVVPIHSAFSHEDQMVAFQKPPQKKVRVVIATEAAESSVTIADADDVIDFGSCKRIAYDDDRDCTVLLPAWISQDSQKQRAGRTGRLRPGNVYRLYPATLKLDERSPPDMTQVPLNSIVLDLKIAFPEMDVDDVLDNLPTPPDNFRISAAHASLEKMKFVVGAEVTHDGYKAHSLGLGLRLARVVLYAQKVGIGNDAALLAVVMSNDTIFSKPTPFYHSALEILDATTKQDDAKSFYERGILQSDALTTCALIKHMRQQSHSRHVSSMGVVQQRLQRITNDATRVQASLGSRDNETPWDAWYAPNNEDLLLMRAVLAWSFADRAVQVRGSGDGGVLELNPASSASLNSSTVQDITRNRARLVDENIYRSVVSHIANKKNVEDVTKAAMAFATRACAGTAHVELLDHEAGAFLLKYERDSNAKKQLRKFDSKHERFFVVLSMAHEETYFVHIYAKGVEIPLKLNGAKKKTHVVDTPRSVFMARSRRIVAVAGEGDDLCRMSPCLRVLLDVQSTYPRMPRPQTITGLPNGIDVAFESNCESKLTPMADSELPDSARFFLERRSVLLHRTSASAQVAVAGGMLALGTAGKTFILESVSIVGNANFFTLCQYMVKSADEAGTDPTNEELNFIRNALFNEATPSKRSVAELRTRVCEFLRTTDARSLVAKRKNVVYEEDVYVDEYGRLRDHDDDSDSYDGY